MPYSEYFTARKKETGMSRPLIQNTRSPDHDHDSKVIPRWEKEAATYAKKLSPSPGALTYSVMSAEGRDVSYDNDYFNSQRCLNTIIGFYRRYGVHHRPQTG